MPVQHFVGSEDAAVSNARRGFLKAGALMVGFWAVPELAMAGSGSAAKPASYVASAFVRIGADDSVTLTMAKVEMGQGAYTVLPMLIAEELEVDLDRVTLRHAPPDAKVYGIPFGDQFTGGSLTIRTLWEPMRQTGAATRMVLIQAAAEDWKVPVSECHAERGAVVHGPSGRRARYGSLVEAAARLPVPSASARSWRAASSKPSRRPACAMSSSSAAMARTASTMPAPSAAWAWPRSS
jgi:isoquinoline 1-oxidoreductase beta subunit